MTEIEKLNQLAAAAKKQGEDPQQIEQALRTELAKSQASDATKEALIERLMQGVKNSSNEKPIIGLDTLNKKPGNYIILANGLKLNADALDV